MADNNNFMQSLQSAAIQIIQLESVRMGTACLQVVRDAKRDCPVDTGILRASITYEVSVSNTEITGTIGSNYEIAPYVHNGTGIYAINGDGRRTPWGYNVRAGRHRGFHWTSGQRPQPFLENAKLQNRGRILQILGGG